MSLLRSLFRARSTTSPKPQTHRSLRYANQAGRKLRLEALEDRQLLSASLVKDVNPMFFGSDPQNLTVMNGQTYLFADDGAKGHELWKTDGTAAGTVLVKDILPGPESSLFHVGRVWHMPMVNVNGTLFFSASDGVRGRELWKSDGTPNGTVLVKDINPGAAASFPHELTNVNGTLFFFAAGANNTSELWKSNGTLAGTVFVKAFTSRGYGSTAVVGTTFYFSAQGTGQSGGVELWKSDGTAAGTVRVKDINPGAANSDPHQLTNVNGTLFFSAVNSSGRELWKSNGTDAGTTLVKNIRSGAADGVSLHADLRALGSALYFQANDGVSGNELWRSDGTAAGTQVFMDLVQGPGDANPEQLTAANGLLYFRTTGTSPQKLWRTNGTVGGTIALGDSLFGSDFTAVNGLVYFQGHTPGTGYELWRSDGTANGTVLVANINPFYDSRPASLVNLNGTLLFTADEMSYRGNVGREVWRSNGTAESTVRVRRINPTPSSSDPSRLSVANGSLYFLADEGLSPGIDVWKSDGTEARTQLVFGTSANPDSLIAVADTVYFTIPGATLDRHELYKIDRVTGLALVRTLSGGSVLTPGNMTAAGSRLFFTTTISPGNRHELWTSDGTTQGTYSVFSSTQPLLNLTHVNGTLFFSAADSATGRELYKSDGTVGGTGRVKDINPGAASSNPSALTDVGGYLWFSATDGANGRELWVSDGTPDFTIMYGDIRAGPEGSDPQNIIAGETYYPLFSADDGIHGRELWMCCWDGVTPSMIKDINPGPGSSNPTNLTDVSNYLFFSADDGRNGREIWFSDWLPDSTFMIADINSGPSSSNPANLTSPDGYHVYYSADDGSTGRELWVSAWWYATYQEADINTGPGSSNPDFLTVLNGSIYFAATEPTIGRELWKATPWASPGGGDGAVAALTATAAPAKSAAPTKAATDEQRREMPPDVPPQTVRDAGVPVSLLSRKDRIAVLFAQEFDGFDRPLW